MFGKKKKDEFQTGLEAGADAPLMAPAPDPSGASLSAIDIQQQEFRLAFRGYNEKDVDEFLDRITEAFTAVSDENRRLRSGNPAAAGSADAAREAEEIKTAARMEADRILREARAQAAAGGAVPAAATGAGTAGVSRFLNQEREFLQGMAGMIQQHAESIRSTAKDVQEEARAGTPAPTTPTPTAPSATIPSAPSNAAPAAPPAAQQAPQEPPAPEPAPPAPPVPSTPEASGVAPTGTPPDTQQTAFGSAWAATMASEADTDAPSVPAAETSATVTTTVEPDSVVSIPPSNVDTPAPVSDLGMSIEMPSQDPAQRDKPDQLQQSQQPQDQRSLRELFWGED